MSNLRKQSRRESSAKDWPAWRDDFRDYPTPDDEKAASELLYDGPSDKVPPDSYFDALADEAMELDRLERGIRHF